jgi:hypothetical protein
MERYMFRVQPKTKASVCLACTAPLLLGIYHSCADEAPTGQLIATMAQPPHLSDMPHAEFDAQYLPSSLTEVSGRSVTRDFSNVVEFGTTT